MKLNQDQKSMLQALVSHPGWKIVKMIEEDESVKLGKSLLNADLTNEKAISILKDSQVYNKARRDFVNDIEKHSREIQVNETKLS